MNICCDNFLLKGEDPDLKKDLNTEVTFERDKELLSVSVLRLRTDLNIVCTYSIF